jgi:hypothetical protein
MHLGRVLQRGHIWALNVGENFALSTEAWEKFAHMYASEPNFGGISGKLKKRMRDIIRANRATDLRHKSFDHIDTIWQIGQMWWNPRNHIIESPLHRILGDKPTRFVCDICRSSIAKDRMLTCSGKGCRSTFHVDCLAPAAACAPAPPSSRPKQPGATKEEWMCPKCTQGSSVKTSKNNLLEEISRSFSVVALQVKVAVRDADDAALQDGIIVQRDPGSRDGEGLPDHFLVELMPSAPAPAPGPAPSGGALATAPPTLQWCVLQQMRCLVGGELVWARLPGLPWLPGQVFRHSVLYPAQHYRRVHGGQQYVRLFSAEQQWAWVPNHSHHLKPLNELFREQVKVRATRPLTGAQSARWWLMPRLDMSGVCHGVTGSACRHQFDGLGTLMLDDEVEVLYDGEYYTAKVKEVIEVRLQDHATPLVACTPTHAAGGVSNGGDGVHCAA